MFVLESLSKCRRSIFLAREKKDQRERLLLSVSESLWLKLSEEVLKSLPSFPPPVAQNCPPRRRTHNCVSGCVIRTHVWERKWGRFIGTSVTALSLRHCMMHSSMSAKKETRKTRFRLANWARKTFSLFRCSNLSRKGFLRGRQFPAVFRPIILTFVSVSK